MRADVCLVVPVGRPPRGEIEDGRGRVEAVQAERAGLLGGDELSAGHRRAAAAVGPGGDGVAAVRVEAGERRLPALHRAGAVAVVGGRRACAGRAAAAAGRPVVPRAVVVGEGERCRGGRDVGHANARGAGRGGDEPGRVVGRGGAIAGGVDGAHVVAVLAPVGQAAERVRGGGGIAAGDGRPGAPAGEVAGAGGVVVEVVLVAVIEASDGSFQIRVTLPSPAVAVSRSARRAGRSACTGPRRRS